MASQQTIALISKPALWVPHRRRQFELRPESIAELYYSLPLPAYHLHIAPDYQFILNPAYNKDRGPVHVFAVRFHLEF
ncbi:MAG: carbohydrate porin [Bacteroidota bacterium]